MCYIFKMGLISEQGNRWQVPLVDDVRGDGGDGGIGEWHRQSRSCIQVVGQQQ